MASLAYVVIYVPRAARPCQRRAFTAATTKRRDDPPTKPTGVT